MSPKSSKDLQLSRKSPKNANTGLAGGIISHPRPMQSRHIGSVNDALCLNDLENVAHTTQPANESEDIIQTKPMSTFNREHDLLNISGSECSFPPLPSIQNDYALEIKSFKYYKKPYY